MSLHLGHWVSWGQSDEWNAGSAAVTKCTGCESATGCLNVSPKCADCLDISDS